MADTFNDPLTGFLVGVIEEPEGESGQPHYELAMPNGDRWYIPTINVNWLFVEHQEPIPIRSAVWRLHKRDATN
jgi:hypothetical protein